MRGIIYVHEHPDWPLLEWDKEKLLPLVAAVRHRQGRLLGRIAALGFDLRTEANMQMLTLNVVKSGEIEGEKVDADQVRSSIARKLGVKVAGLVPVGRDVEGLVQMMLDATQAYDKPLSEERLFAWHSAMFPAGRSRMENITVGNWRTNSDDNPMQVISGPIGKEKVHFQAPSSKRLAKEMKAFIRWFNEDTKTDDVLKAGIAHFWFVTIHPFDDGNGRIARAVSDLLLARSDDSNQRFYSMSSQIQAERKQYYDILEATQKGKPDITAWLEWFLNCLDRSLTSSEETLTGVLQRAGFWKEHATTPFNDRQIRMLHKLLDHFEGSLSTSKWAKMMKCSQDTALRDIQDLVDKNILKKNEGGGRSTNYTLSGFK